MIPEVHQVLSETLRAHALDARSCYTAVFPERPGGRMLVVQCSDAGVAGDLRKRLAEALGGSAAGVRLVLLPDGADTIPELVVASTSVVDVRKSPTHASELVTQLIRGDAATPLKQEGDWILARLDDGYIGWIRNWHLTAVSPDAFEAFSRTARHRVGANIIQLFEAPDGRALPVGDAVVGTRVRVETSGKRGWSRVVFADGRMGYTKSGALSTIPRAKRPDRGQLGATGLKFLGIPYLWGGTTPKGFDCSGLVQRIFRLHGVLLPRDSDLQARHGRLKAPHPAPDLEAGDLLFFGKDPSEITHVAMYLRDGVFLHAHGQVRLGALDSRHPLFDGGLVERWRLSRDPLST